MFTLEVLQDYEARGLIKSSESNGYTVWCYTQQCVVERVWDEITRSCRGLVLSPSGELVSRPFPKFFNWNEPEAVIEDGPFIAFDKMDGSLIVVGNHNGSAVVSTKGSFETWHSEYARELLMGFVPPEGVTCLFEFIHPENRIVLDYADYEGLIFLGAVDNETGRDIGYPEEAASDFGWHGDVVVHRNFNLQNMINTVQDPEAGEGREGFVIVWRSNDGPSNRIKLKFAQYVQLHSIYTGLTTRKIWECLCDDTLGDLMEVAPDELHDDIARTVSTIVDDAQEMYNRAVQVGSEAMLEPDRKSAAAHITASLDAPLTGLAFKVYDGKHDEALKMALKLSRPEVSVFVGSAGLA